MLQSLQTTKSIISGSKENVQKLGEKGDITPRVRKAEEMRYDNREEKEFLWMPAILCGTEQVN